MKEKMRNILFFIMVLFFYSCSSEKQGRNAVDYSMMNNLKVSVEKAVDIDVKSAMCLSASEFMKNHLEALTYVQLDSALPLGNVEKLTVAGRKVALLSRSQIYAYDLDTGKLLYHIDKKGHGHNEYVDIRNIQIIPEDNEIMAVDDLGKSYFYFDLNNGQFLRKETSLIGSMVACKYNHLYFSSIVNGNDFNDRETWGLVASDSTKLRYKQFLLYPLQEGDFVVDNLHVFDNKLFYTPVFSDTIYSVNDKNNVSATYVINQKNSIWTKKKEHLSFSRILELMTRNGYTCLDGNRIFISKDVLFFQLLKGRRNGFLEEKYVYIIKDKKLYNLQTNELFGEQFSVFPHVICDVDKNTFYGIYLDGQKFKDICKSANLQITDEKLKKVLESKQINHNPILVSFKMKRT